MSEGNITNPGIEITALTEEEKQKSRSLWEEIFKEDTKEFLDYYYREKTRDNHILAVKQQGEIVSMLHLNPYKLMVSGKVMQSYYIVAVATKPEYRHRGYMAALLKAALEKAAGEGCPFVFLMPAKEEIYTPFDFATVYQRKDYTLTPPEEEISGNTQEVTVDVLSFPLKSFPEEDISQQLGNFYREILGAESDIYTLRDESYIHTALLEQQSEGGGILLFRSGEGKQIVGSCFYSREGCLELRELLCKRHWEKAILRQLYQNNICQRQVKLYGGLLSEETVKAEKTVPCSMFRITNLEALHGRLVLESVSTESDFKECKVKVLDRLLPQQQGVYHLFEIKKENISYLEIQKCECEETYEQTITMEEFIRKYVSNQKIFLNEVV